MDTEWNEIKRLAADFQKIQLTSSLQKLSERNCIEIVTLLIEKGLIEVIYTNDGKEYVTLDHLEKEILDELSIRGGRINLTEISKILNIDFLKINAVAEKLVNHNKIFLILGQLIDDVYITRVANEINEKLIRNGEISISDLTVLFDLPSDFLQNNIIEKHLGNIIRGRQDSSNSGVFYTQSYVLRCKSKVRGAIAAVTRPISVSIILQQIRVPEKMFNSLLDEIALAGSITSKLARAEYIPHIHAKMQNDWINSFFNQNGFIEYNAILKLGISDPKQFIRKQFPGEKITFLKSCAVGSKITELPILSSLTDSSYLNYIELASNLPSIMSDEEMHELAASMLPPGSQNKYMLLGTTIFSVEFLNNLISPCKSVIKTNARQLIESGIYQQYLVEKLSGNSRSNQLEVEQSDLKIDKKEERRKKALSGKSGGGTVGRETKMKSNKKHQRGEKKNVDSDEENVNRKEKQCLEIISLKEIKKCIENNLEEEGLEDICEEIAESFYNQLNQEGHLVAQELHETSPQTQRRQNYSLLQDKLDVLLADIRLYEKGLKHFSPEVQSQYIKYLLKSMGNDICNDVALYIANECNLNIKNTALSAEQRNKIAHECGPEYKQALLDLIKTINSNSIEDFLNGAEVVLKTCGMILKKVDKKKDKLLIIQHKEKLCQQLIATEDPAVALHLTVLILFTIVTGNILHASGKFVSYILTFLQPQLNSTQYQILTQFHDLVLKLLSAGNESEEGKTALQQLQTLQEELIKLVMTYEKSNLKTREQ